MGGEKGWLGLTELRAEDTLTKRIRHTRETDKKWGRVGVVVVVVRFLLNIYCILNHHL